MAEADDDRMAEVADAVRVRSQIGIVVTSGNCRN